MQSTASLFLLILLFVMIDTGFKHEGDFINCVQNEALSALMEICFHGSSHVLVA
jgi:hypothetical protein